jgi:cell division protease FtsH
MSFGKSRARLNTDAKNRVTFRDVAGCDEAKEELQEVIEFLKDPRRFQKLGGKIPKGVLLFGAPGTGKTLLARAVAGEANVPFFSISGSDFVEMFVGVGASRVRDLFEQGKKSAPCIIFIDEIDAVGRHRFAGIGGGHDEREQTLNALLVEMDGFVTNEGVILIAATNRPDVLDPALLRPGRFDRQITVDLPDLGGRKGILEVHTRNVVLDQAVNLDTLARRTPGFSGADLANVCNEAALLGARRKKDAVDMLDFEDAIDRVMAGPEKKSRIISADEKKVIAYHEAGHALMYLYIDEIDPLHKVSILPRGRALGYTMQLPTDDKFLTSKMELLGNVTALLGGRVSEELVFNEVWTGSTNDLERATILAHKMVCEFGMSDKLGPLTFGNSGHEVFLGMDLGRERSYSEEIAFEIDKEVRAIVDGSHERARKLLEDHRDDLEALANALLEREVLDKEEVFKLLGLPAEKEPHEPPTAVATGREDEKGAKSPAIDLGPEPQPA